MTTYPCGVTVVTRVEYQVLHPNGTVIYREIVASHLDWDHVPKPWVLSLRVDGGGGLIMPPWILQRREDGGDWATVAERPVPAET